MRPHLLFGLGTLALSACNPWDHLPDSHYTELDGPLWSPESAIARQDGIYVHLPEAGRLVRVDADGGVDEVPVDGAVVTDLRAGADDSTLLAFLDRYTCADPKARFTDDCSEEDLTTLESIAVVRDATIEQEITLDAGYNEVAFSSDGAWALAYFDFATVDLDAAGVISLDSVVAVNLADGTTTPVSVGFDADRILFTYEASGAATKAVVLSQSSVAVIDLTAQIPVRTTTFPLTLDVADVVTPSGVELTPDGRYALISTEGSSDLYALDLVNESINIVELGGVPASMATDEANGVTLVTYASGATGVDLVDDADFSINRVDLDERTTEIVEGSSFAMLWGPGLRDVYRLDPADGSIVKYHLQNDAANLYIVPGEQYALAITSAGSGIGPAGYPGMEILDLSDNDSVPYKLDGFGLGVAFDETDSGPEVLLLQEGVDYLLRLNLGGGTMEQVDLPAPPVGIGAIPPSGPFYITHTSGTGLVSFLQPDGSLVTAGGFAVVGVGEQVPVAPEEN